ncbi:MAG TPA: hypothetical protein VEJ87_09780 [Acidimicrobiales bacterium]|nr:hypothetical protein [Acidimicrobiales bacterium]
MANPEDASSLIAQVHQASLKLTALLEEKLPLATVRDPEWDARFRDTIERMKEAWDAYEVLPPGPERRLP